MTIEETLSRLAINSGRIADALEAIAASQGIVPDAPGDDLDDDEPEAKPPASKKKTSKKKTAKKVAKKKASKKKASKKKAVGKKKAAEPTTDLTIKDDVRPVLKRLRDEVSHAAVKSLLKKYSASTIQQLDESNYQRIIDDALAELGDEDDIDDFDEDQGELDLDDDDDL